MASIIEISGRFDNNLVTRVKRSLQSVSKSEKEIIFQIKSYGGNLEAFRKLSGFIYFFSKYRKTKIIGELIYGESAALLLFLNCEERRVMPGSIGSIHLPVPNKHKTESEILEQQKEVARFIRRRTGLIERKIYELQHQSLGLCELLKYNIATKKSNFFLIPSAA